MNRNALRVQHRVNNAWNNAIYGLKQMDQSSTVRPQEAMEIFTFANDAPDNVVKLIVGPVVFKVHERPNHRRAGPFHCRKGLVELRGT